MHLFVLIKRRILYSYFFVSERLNSFTSDIQLNMMYLIKHKEFLSVLVELFLHSIDDLSKEKENDVRTRQEHLPLY